MTPNPILVWRQSLGLTQEALAQKLGLSHSTVSKWEREKRPQVPSRLALRVLRKAGFKPQTS